MRLFFYLLKPLFFYKIMVLIFSFAIYVFIDFSYRLKKLSSLAALGEVEFSFEHLLRFYFYDLPIQWSISLPAAILVACVVVLIKLQRQGEIHAMRTLGQSNTKLMAPLLTLGAIGAISSVWIEEVGVAWGSTEKQKLYAELEGHSPNPSLPLWIHHQDWFYSYGSFDPDSGTLHELKGYQRTTTPPFKVKTMIFAPQIIKTAASTPAKQLNWWRATHVDVFHFESDQMKYEKKSQYLLELPYKPQYSFFTHRRAKQLSLSELHVGRSLAEKSNFHKIYEMSYYEKLAMIAITFLFPFLTIKFLYLAPRVLSLAKELTVTLCLGVLFWLLISLTKAFTLSHNLPMFLVALLPLFLMMLASLAEFLRHKKP